MLGAFKTGSTQKPYFNPFVGNIEKKHGQIHFKNISFFRKQTF